MHTPAEITEKNHGATNHGAAHETCVASTRSIETPRLLFVDDYADFLGMVRIVFRDGDYLLQTETESPRALKIAAEFKPHVIISDIGMPLLDGYELVKTLRETPGIAPFKAVALSGYAAMEHQEKALLCGFDACFVKPVDFEQLRETIDQLSGELIIETMPENHLEMRPDARKLTDFSDA